jgi:uracil phosphoribosyltransferase
VTAWKRPDIGNFKVEEHLGGSVLLLTRTAELVSLHTMIRDERADHATFVGGVARIARLVLEAALSELPRKPRVVRTPTGATFDGLDIVTPLAVSVPRAGDAFEFALREIRPDIAVGKILVQRDPVSKSANLIYVKLPSVGPDDPVLLMDPTIATAGTIRAAVQTLLERGAREENIVVANILTCPEAIATLVRTNPKLRVVTSFIDDGLTDQAFMSPGLGDFGDRYFGTWTPARQIPTGPIEQGNA